MNQDQSASTPHRESPSQHPSTGIFIAVEGGDGAGKTTQLDLLESWLTDREVPLLRTREPGGTEIGERIRALVLDHGQGEIDPRTEAFLFAASRAAHVTQKIRPALESGQWVLTDRFLDSSIAYQGVGRGLGVNEVSAINTWAVQGVSPDLTIILDVDPATSQQRRLQRNGGTEDRIESADLDFHQRLRQAFLDQARLDPHRYLIVDAAEGAETIHDAIKARVGEFL